MVVLSKFGNDLFFHAIRMHRNFPAMKKTIEILGVTVCLLLLFSGSSFLCSISYGQGIFLRASGAVNESMGGATTAAPIDAQGCLQWNPAGISMLERNEVDMGMGLVIPSCEFGSSATNLQTGKVESHVTRGEPGAVAVPSMGFIYHKPNSNVTYGLGMSAFAGAKLAYPYLGEDHQMLTSVMKDSRGMDLNCLNSDIYLLQIAPTVSWKLSENLSFGAAPTITMAQVLCDPLFVSQMPDGYITPTSPVGISSRYAWGAGFQLGVYYKTNCDWAFGFCYKSQNWMEPLRYHTKEMLPDETEVGGVRKLHLNVPDVMTFGIAYSGFDKTLIALDLRRFGYADSGGDYLRMGWKNLFGLNLGVQRIINERWTMRAGYAYNDCPYSSEYTLANSATPMITQHVVFLGSTVKMTENIEMTLAYSHAFDNKVSRTLMTEPIYLSASSEIGADTLTMGLRFLF